MSKSRTAEKTRRRLLEDARANPEKYARQYVRLQWLRLGFWVLLTVVLLWVIVKSALA